MKSTKEMFEELGYLKDKEPRFEAFVSYTKYCVDGCCRLNDILANGQTTIFTDFDELEKR